MSKFKTAVILGIFLSLFTAAAFADTDFDVFLKSIDVKAEADIGGFKASVRTRFDTSRSEVDLVFGSVEKPSDAYMCLRVARLAGCSVEAVLREYRKNRGKGWGAMAKNLGIKPGSKAFHALKDDPFGDDASKGKGKSKDKKH